ncbi:MAG: hypothetical protein HFF90_08620 [Oscillibacter sp.]|nr:hypothetical protein [Oscillibacter sp.]
MERVQITMEHTEKSVRRLAKVQYDTFSARAKLFWYGLCLLCILAGLGLLFNLEQFSEIAIREEIWLRWQRGEEDAA